MMRIFDWLIPSPAFVWYSNTYRSNFVQELLAHKSILFLRMMLRFCYIVTGAGMRSDIYYTNTLSILTC